MITIPEVVERYIKASPYLEDMIAKGLINLSALARYYKNDIEEELMKPAQEGAIIMGLKRLANSLTQRDVNSRIFTHIPEMIVRSNLFEITIPHTSTLQLMTELSSIVKSKEQRFLTVTEGVFETTIISSNELKSYIVDSIPKKDVISVIDNLASITIKLPKENVYTVGIYYMILKALAWENINLVEVVSTTNENSVILSEEDVDRAFSALKKLFKS
jgi:hypothetical protein